MTEAEWLCCTAPAPMLGLLNGKVSDRKLRLFAVSCCQRIRHLLPDKRSRQAIRTARLSVDGWASLKQCKSDWLEAGSVSYINADPSSPLNRRWAFHRAAEAAAMTLNKGLSVGTVISIYDTIRDALMSELADHFNRGYSDMTNDPLIKVHERAMAAIVRDIFGNLFRPVVFDRAWLGWSDGAVAKIAQAIYEESAFDRKPILADALTDAGCNNADILNHCRDVGPHVRGCWVVDLLLEKE
jgi:hypothetical protein